MTIEKIDIKLIKLNPNNPRIIKDGKFKKLVKSIKEFPQMLEVRPIVVDDDLIVLGGNMRLKACIEAGLREVHIIRFENLTDEKKKEFIIKDNVGYGEWDFEVLANDWSGDLLIDWGVDFEPQNINYDIEGIDYSGKNTEIDVDNLDGQMIIKLNYKEEEYWQVKDQLNKIASTPEQAVWKLLGN